MSQKDAVDAKPLTTIPGHNDAIRNIAYLPGEKRIVTCSQDKTVRIWDVETGEQEGTSMEQESPVRCLAVTRDGTKILSGGEDGRIRVWDVTTHEPIERWGTHTGAILSIDLSPDDRLAASGHRYGQIVIREVKENGRIKHSVMAGGSVRSVCFSPDGEKLACAVTDHLADNGVYVIQVYDVESGELVLGPMKGHDNEICCVLWSLDGNQLFSGSKDETIRCWNCITSEPIGQPWTGHTHIVASLSLSPDGSKLASASLDKTVRFWDAHSGDPIEQPLQHNGCPRAVTFSPSGQFVASGGYDRKLSIWRVPWWGDSHKEAPARNSFLDLPAVPVPKGPANSQQQGELDFLDLLGSRRPFASSSRHPIHPADRTTDPIMTRLRHLWRGLVAHRTSSELSPTQQAIDHQSTQGRPFWKPSARTPVTEVATGRLTDRVKVGRREPRKKKTTTKKDDKARKPEEPRTHTGRRSSFAQSSAGSDDSWDDMDGCDKCVDYCCFGPRENRERFRPWRKKSPAVIKAEKRARKGKRKQNSPRHLTSEAVDSQNAVHPPHPEHDHKTAAPASPAADKADLDLRRVVLQLQEEVKQLRRQLNDSKRKEGVEKDGLENDVEQSQYSGQVTLKPQHPQMHTGEASTEAGPSLSYAEPSGSNLDAGVPTPSTSFTVLPKKDLPAPRILTRTPSRDKRGSQAREEESPKTVI